MKIPCSVLALIYLMSALSASASNWIVALETAEDRCVIFDGRVEEGYAWEWKAEQDARIRRDHLACFSGVADVVPTQEGKLLVVCSGSAFAQIDVVTARVDYYGMSGLSGSCSIAALPMGLVAMASRDEGRIVVLDAVRRNGCFARCDLVASTGLSNVRRIVWDARGNCLWGASRDCLVRYSWNGKSLIETDRWSLADKGVGECVEDCALAGSGEIFVATRSAVYRFDVVTATVRRVRGLESVRAAAVQVGDRLISAADGGAHVDSVALGDARVGRKGAHFSRAQFYPEHMMPWLTVREPDIPMRDFCITNYGAKADGTVATDAFEAAMRSADLAGGGRIIVPSGKWLTGRIRLRNNCELHFEDGAVLSFTDSPADYLPSVPTSWEGVECYNYSPLVYGYGVTNVAITGKGLICPRMKRWRTWFKRSPAHMAATECLYHWCATNAPIEMRDVSKIEGANVRPHLMQFNRCRNVLLQGFSIKESPFWMIHLYLSSDCIVRSLKTNCHGQNNDGVDIEMTRNVLVEDCEFNQGDDGVVLKSGRNQDAWRLATPTENVIVRNCKFLFAHVLLGVGSELSGGVRNIWMHDCEIGDCHNMFYFKTNRRRGGFVENVFGERLKAQRVQYAGIGIETDVLYQWARFPDYEVRYTPIRNIVLKDSMCKQAGWAVRLLGDEHLPPENITVDGFAVGRIGHADVVENCKNVKVNTRVGQLLE